jgi:hypothetical protein
MTTAWSGPPPAEDVPCGPSAASSPPEGGRAGFFRGGGGWRRRLGFGLVLLSFILYGCLLLVPSAPLSTSGKVALSSFLVVSGEASFWVGGFILGREVVARWRGRLDPRRWIRGRG